MDGEAAEEDFEKELQDNGLERDQAEDLLESGRSPGEVGENNGPGSYVVPVAIMVGAGITLYVCCS